MAFSGFTPAVPSSHAPELTWSVGSGQQYETLESAIAAAKTAWASKVTLSLTDSTYTYDPDSESLQANKPITIEPETKNSWDCLFYKDGLEIPAGHEFSGKGEGVADISVSDQDITITGTTTNPDFTGVTGDIIIYNSASGEPNTVTISSVSTNVITVTGTIPSISSKDALFFVPPTKISIESPIELNKDSNLTLENLFFENLFVFSDEIIKIDGGYLRVKDSYFFNLSGGIEAKNASIEIEGFMINYTQCLDANNCNVFSPKDKSGYFANMDSARIIYCEYCNFLVNVYAVSASNFATHFTHSKFDLNLFINRKSGNTLVGILVDNSDGIVGGHAENCTTGFGADGCVRVDASMNVVNCTTGYSAAPTIGGNCIVDATGVTSTSGTTTAWAPATSGTADSKGNILYHN